MPGCQAVMPNGRHCRNYARKNGMTCCYSHRYLENIPAEIEIPMPKKERPNKKEPCYCADVELNKMNGEWVWICDCRLRVTPM